MRKPTGSLKAVVALAILILGAGCSQSPTAPEPTDASLGVFINGGTTG